MKQAYLAKVHGLDTFTTKRRTDWGTRTGLSGSNDELHDLVDSAGSSSFRHCGGCVVIWGKAGVEVELESPAIEDFGACRD
jgi:hypothetical protein